MPAIMTVKTLRPGSSGRFCSTTLISFLTLFSFSIFAQQTEFDHLEISETEKISLPPFRSVLINRLIAERGGRIEFPVQNSGGDGAQGTPASSGASGSYSILWIREIEGDVFIEARGGNGGVGQPGQDGRQGKDGAKGRRGRVLIPGIYISRGEDGRPGEPGENGGDGGDGGSGGRGGKVVVIYARKSSDSSIVVDVNGGEGGSGGRGGLGGLGGNGGLGGAKGYGGGDQGPMGPKGLDGRSGRPGVPGAPGVVSIYQVSETLFDCLSEVDLELDVMGVPPEERDRSHYEHCQYQETAQRSVSKSVELKNAFSNSEMNSENKSVIHISANGQNGTNAPISFQFPPFDGLSASNGGSLTLLWNQLPEKIFISARGGNGGHGAQGIRGRDGAGGGDGRRGGLFRKSKPGEDGEDGQNGGSGSNGGAGGNGGLVRVVWIDSQEDVDASWQDRFIVDVEGGLGGSGGFGGSGGRGGPAGKGGKRFLLGKYREDGKPGIDGVPGNPGVDGSAGSKGIVEFHRARSEFDWLMKDLFESETPITVR